MPEIGPDGQMLFLYKKPPPHGYEDEEPYVWPVGNKTLFIGILMDSLKNIPPRQKVAVSAASYKADEECPVYINIWKVKK